MYLFTDVQTDMPETLAGREITAPGQQYSEYRMNFAVQLDFMELHPEEELDYFTIFSIAPDRFYHTSCTRDEMKSQFARPSLHRHAYFELVYVLKGSLYQIIENERHLYTPGCFCLLNENVLHTEEHGSDYEVVFLGLTKEYLSGVYRELKDGLFDVESRRPVRELDEFLKENLSRKTSYEKKYMDFVPRQQADPSDEGRMLLQEIADVMLDPVPGATAQIRLLLVRLLILLSDPLKYETVPIRIGTEAENLLFDEIDRIMREGRGHVSRHFLEEELHYSGDYINKITKKYTGYNIHDYGMSICMQKAASLLATTQKSVDEIAAETGFANLSHFYRQFKKIYSMTPMQYRNRRV